MNEQLGGAEDAGRVDGGSLADMLAGLDEAFDLVVTKVIPPGSGLEGEKEQLLGDWVQSFEDQVVEVRAQERSAEGEDVLARFAARREALEALRDRAAERFMKETGKEWAPA